MEPHVQPGALGRSAEQVGAARAIALAMYQHEPEGTIAKPWLGGMVAAGTWLLGLTDQSPVSHRTGPATRASLDNELLAAGQADMPGDGNPRDPAKMYARGAYRMLVYALGLRDEMPVKLSTEVARKMLDELAA